MTKIVGVHKSLMRILLVDAIVDASSGTKDRKRMMLWPPVVRSKSGLGFHTVIAKSLMRILLVDAIVDANSGAKDRRRMMLWPQVVTVQVRSWYSHGHCRIEKTLIDGSSPESPCIPSYEGVEQLGLFCSLNGGIVSIYCFI